MIMSMYKITIPEDLISRPTVKKWSARLTSWEVGEELKIPVTGTIQTGHHIGITSRGLCQYNMPPGHIGPPLPFEEVPGRFRGKGIVMTSPIVGLFFDRKSAEVCYETVFDKLNEPFKPQWWWDTRTVLTTIGTDHPLVVISTTPGRFEVPRFLWSESEPVPFVELSKGS